MTAPPRRGCLRRLITGGGVLALLLGVGYLVLAFWWIRVERGPQQDFLVELNQPLIDSAVDRGAWPALKPALEALGLPGRRVFPEELQSAVMDLDPDEQANWLRDREPVLARIREAVGRPVLGLPHAFALPSPEDRWLLLTPGDLLEVEAAAPDSRAAAAEPPFLLELSPRYVGTFRALARLLEVAGRAALEAGHPERALDDVLAILDLSRLCLQDPLMISQLGGLAIRALAEQCLLDLLADPRAASDERLLDRISEAFLAPGSAGALPSFEGERLILLDVLQRFYSDDGSGDGVPLFSPSVLSTFTGTDSGSVPGAGLGEWLLRPIMIKVVGTRREVLETYDDFIAESERLMEVDFWSADWSTLDAMQEELRGVRPLRLFPLGLLLFGPEAVIKQGMQVRFTHQLVETVVALLRYRLRDGAWPRDLEELVPGLLPALPRDPWTGAPLGYGLRNGVPELWSVGPDRVDDGGTFAESRTPFFLGRKVPARKLAAGRDHLLWRGFESVEGGPQSP
ncbi:MAG: hypothetical protein VX403_11330 [Planctomycetota bacterium]|nr:hypothetical protein [Planctomycetota bacterium]